jgi:hypothetical protein
MTGAQGITGPQGPTGIGLTGIGLTGPQGPTGAQGLTGAGASSFSGAFVQSTATQSLVNNTLTAVIWDSETHDIGGWHDNVTNNTRLTVPSGVNYVVVAAGIEFANNATGLRACTMRKNGSGIAGMGASMINAQADGSNATRINVVSAPLAVTAGDYFELFAQQTSGGALNVTNGTTTWFAIRAVG